MPGPAIRKLTFVANFGRCESRFILVLGFYCEVGGPTPAGDRYSTLDTQKILKIPSISKTYPKHIFEHISASATTMIKSEFRMLI